MALSTVIKTTFDAGTIVVTDGTAVTPLTVTARFDQGDMTIDELVLKGRETKAYQARGRFTGLRRGQRVPVPFSFSMQMADVSESGSGTLADMVWGTGAYASRVTTGAIGGDVVTLDVTFTIEGTTYGDAADEVIVLKTCDLKLSIAEGDPNTIKVSGLCYGQVTTSGTEIIPAN